MPDANASSANFNACASAMVVERRVGRHRRCHGEQQTYMSEPTWQLYERGYRGYGRSSFAASSFKDIWQDQVIKREGEREYEQQYCSREDEN